MPRIINTFASENPLAKVIGSLGNSMWGDTLTPAVKRQQLADMQREQTGIEEMARVFGGTTGGNVNIPRAVESGILGGLKPDDIAAFNMLMTGTQTPLGSDLTNRAYVGAGKANVSPWNLGLDRQQEIDINTADNVQSGINQRYSSDSSYRSSTENNAADNMGLMTRWAQEPKPAMVGDKPGFVQQDSLVSSGAAPIMNENQVAPLDQFKRQLLASEVMFPGDPAKARQHAIAQLSKAPPGKGITYTDADGNTLTVGGEAGGPAPTTANMTQMQYKEARFNDFMTIAQKVHKLAADPNAALDFGIAGNVRNMTQGAAQLSTNIAGMLGYQDVNSAIDGVRKEALANGAEPGVVAEFLVFDPNISAIDAMSKVLLFKMAEALGQVGQGTSDKDIKIAKSIAGDPLGWGTTQESYLTRLSTSFDVIRDMRNNNRRGLGMPDIVDGIGGPAAPAAGAPAVTPPATVPPPAAGVEQWTIGPDGKPLRVQ